MIQSLSMKHDLTLVDQQKLITLLAKDHDERTLSENVSGASFSTHLIMILGEKSTRIGSELTEQG